MNISYELSPTQIKISDECYNVINRSQNKINVLLLYGDKGTGKDNIVNYLISHYYSEYKLFNLSITDIKAPEGKNVITCNNLQRELLVLYTKLIESSKTILFISHLDEFYDVFDDLYSDNRKLSRIVIRNFLRSIANKEVIVFITSRNNEEFSLSNVWSIKYKLKTVDTDFFIRRHINDDYVVNSILAINKKQYPWIINQIFNYINHSSSIEQNTKNMVEEYMNMYTKLHHTIDHHDSIPTINKNSDLIGLDQLLLDIDINILHPLQLNNLDYYPIKRGIIIYGPSGTGKSSIGRYLAGRLNNKFYLVNGSDISDDLNIVMKRAEKNLPCVIFIDDIDFILSDEHICRSLLVMLDGIENKYRNKICVIMTCIDINKIPIAMLRGKRLELILETKYPTQEVITKLVKDGFDTINKFQSLQSEIIYFIPLDDSLISYTIKKFEGWNHADIRRALEDIQRHLIYYEKQKDKNSIISMSIDKIEQQRNKLTFLNNNNNYYI